MKIHDFHWPENADGASARQCKRVLVTIIFFFKYWHLRLQRGRGCGGREEVGASDPMMPRWSCSRKLGDAAAGVVKPTKENLLWCELGRRCCLPTGAPPDGGGTSPSSTSIADRRFFSRFFYFENYSRHQRQSLKDYKYLLLLRDATGPVALDASGNV